MAREIRWNVIARGFAHLVELVGVIFRFWVITESDWLRGLTITMATFEVIGIIGSIFNTIPGFYFGALLPMTFVLRLGGLVVSALAVTDHLDDQLAAIIGVGVGGGWTIFEFLLTGRIGLRDIQWTSLEGISFSRAISSRLVRRKERLTVTDPVPGEWETPNGDRRVTDYLMPLFTVAHVAILSTTLIVRIVWTSSTPDYPIWILLLTMFEGIFFMVTFVPIFRWEPRTRDWESPIHEPTPLKFSVIMIGYGIGLLIGTVALFIDLLTGPTKWMALWALSGVAILLLAAILSCFGRICRSVPVFAQSLLEYVCPKSETEAEPTTESPERRPEPV